ncbi:hypothetical protein KUCAC02_034312 [Chaenocephalus aceratus]|nr:hypothetical protein KUCAC02_034312 [Chaenocephalus aceratus]
MTEMDTPPDSCCSNQYPGCAGHAHLHDLSDLHQEVRLYCLYCNADDLIGGPCNQCVSVIGGPCNQCVSVIGGPCNQCVSVIGGPCNQCVSVIGGPCNQVCGPRVFSFVRGCGALQALRLLGVALGVAQIVAMALSLTLMWALSYERRDLTSDPPSPDPPLTLEMEPLT